MLTPLLLGTGLLGCGPASTSIDDTATTVDERMTEAALPAIGADDQLWWGPEAVVEPGADVQYCLFGTYTGPDIGIHAFDAYQGASGHHLILMGTTSSALDFPDGTLLDCSRTDSLPMTELEPLILPTAGDTGLDALNLPEGMATKLRTGQRWVLQAHWLNATTENIRVRDVAVVNTVAVEDVITWAAPLVMNNSNFSLPPHQESEVSFECTFDQDYHVLYWLGHMHEFGTHFSLAQMDGDSATPIYDTAWNVSYRDTPPVNAYEENEYLLPAGTTMRTTCHWNNTTDGVLEFPHEMCDAVAMVWPALTSDICDAP